MFKDLRLNNPFFILRKGEKPNFEIGSVQNVSTPIPKAQNYNVAFFQPELVVDVKVKIGNEVINFEKLPATAAIADFSQNGSSGIVVSCNRDLIRNEIETMLAQSKSMIESVTYHENVIKECEDILKNLNPSFAKEKQQEEEIKGLKTKICEFENKLGSLDEIKQMLGNVLNTKNNNLKEK